MSSHISTLSPFPLALPAAIYLQTIEPCLSGYLIVLVSNTRFYVLFIEKSQPHLRETVDQATSVLDRSTYESTCTDVKHSQNFRG
jgi:hypothetical protein